MGMEDSKIDRSENGFIKKSFESIALALTGFTVIQFKYSSIYTPKYFTYEKYIVSYHTFLI